MYSRSMWSRNSRSGSAPRLGGQLDARQLGRASRAPRAGGARPRRRSPRADRRRRCSRPHRITSRSTTLRSSRTLPGQSYAGQHRRAPRRIDRLRLRCRSRRQHSRRTTRDSSGMSSARSRSGGARSGTTLRRKYRSSRNCPAATAACEVAVGRGDHAHVDLQRLLAADPRELAGLQHAQHLGLRRQRSCRRSRRGRACRRRRARTGRACGAVAPVNAPRSWPNSSLSISSGGIAAQLTLTNGLSRQRAVAVDRARDQLLAGAALAGDQHARCGSARPSRSGANSVAHRRALADHLAALVDRRAQAAGPRAHIARRSSALRSVTSTRSRSSGFSMKSNAPSLASRAPRPSAWRARRS